MATYNVSVDRVGADDTVVLRVGFGEPAQNDQIVRDAVAAVRGLNLSGGKAVALNGPASLPAAVALSHELGHLFGAILVFDPKMAGYVVAVSHDPAYAVGDVIPADQI